MDRNEIAELCILVSANICICISSNLFGLLVYMGDVSIHSETWLCSSEIRYRGNGEFFFLIVIVYNFVLVVQCILFDRRLS